MDGDLPEEKSSSDGALLSKTMGSLPLLRTIGCSARSPSYTSFLSSRFFST